MHARRAGDARLPLSCIVVGIVVLWQMGALEPVLDLAAALVLPEGPMETTQEESNRILMHDVRVQGFDETMRPAIELGGDSAITFKDSQEVIIQPVTGVIHRGPGRGPAPTAEDVHVRANHGRKGLLRNLVRLEFIGAVDVRTGGRQLRSERLLYIPATHHLETPVPVQLTTTGTILQAGRLTSNAQLKSGQLDGEVSLTTISRGSGEGRTPSRGRRHPTVERAPRRPAGEVPVTIKGDRATFDAVRGLYEVIGHARGRRGAITLEAQRVRYDRTRDVLWADGDEGHLVKLVKPGMTLTCGQLEYLVSLEQARATSSPVVVQEVKPARESPSRNTFRARVMSADLWANVLRGEGEVVFARSVEFEGDWEPDYEIRSTSVDARLDSRRATFRDAVSIRSSRLGATGQKAVLYQDSRKMYIVGSAQAWDYGARGERKNVVQGNIIVHNIQTGENRVLDKVHLVLPEEARE